MKYIYASIANFSAVLILLVIIFSPFYFAKNMTNVAGVKTTTPYIITSQIDKFPNVTLSQQGQTYNISYQKLGTTQEFQELLILTNPTPESQRYQILTLSGKSNVFFGKAQEQSTQISLPAGASAPISLFTSPDDGLYSSVIFKIQTY